MKPNGGGRWRLFRASGHTFLRFFVTHVHVRDELCKVYDGGPGSELFRVRSCLVNSLFNPLRVCVRVCACVGSYHVCALAFGRPPYSMEVLLFWVDVDPSGSGRRTLGPGRIVLHNYNDSQRKGCDMGTPTLETMLGTLIQIRQTPKIYFDFR